MIKDSSTPSPRESVRPPAGKPEWDAWDAYAAAALTSKASAKDAAAVADEMMEFRRRRYPGAA